MENSQGILHSFHAFKKSIKEVYKNISLQKNQIYCSSARTKESQINSSHKFQNNIIHVLDKSHIQHLSERATKFYDHKCQNKMTLSLCFRVNNEGRDQQNSLHTPFKHRVG